MTPQRLPNDTFSIHEIYQAAQADLRMLRSAKIEITATVNSSKKTLAAAREALQLADAILAANDSEQPCELATSARSEHYTPSASIESGQLPTERADYPLPPQNAGGSCEQYTTEENLAPS